MGIFIFGVVVVALGIAACFVTYGKRRAASPCRCCKTAPRPAAEAGGRAAEAPGARVSPQAEKFFGDAVAQYQEKLLSYCILSVAEESGLSADKRLKLTERYGMVSLAPMLINHLSGMKEAGLRQTDVDNAANLWLKNNGAPAAGGDPPEAVEKYLTEKMREKAAEVIRQSSLE